MYKLALWTALTAIALAASAAQAADSVIATVPGPTELDAYGGRLVWSEPSPDGYRLVEYRNGSNHPLPIRPRAAPFDVDLGPGPHGGVVAVYSRCVKEPTGGVFGLDGRSGCDLYTYDFGSGHETAIRTANSTADEYLPTIWRKRVAFTRTYDRTRTGGKQRLTYWRRYPSGGASRRLASKPAYVSGPTELDLRGDRAALFWAGEFGGGDVQLASIRRRSRIVSQVPQSGAAAQAYEVSGTSIARGFVYWLLTQTADTPLVGEIRRDELARRREERAAAPIDPHAVGFAQDGATSYYIRPQSPGSCGFMRLCPGPYEIHRLDGLRFERAPTIQLR